MPRAPAGRLARTRRRVGLLCALVAAALAVGACFVGARASGPRPGPRRAEASSKSIQVLDADPQPITKVSEPAPAPAPAPSPPPAPEDDGKALDTSEFVGGLGALVVAVAVLPYVPVLLYSAFTLATTGKGLPDGPYGVYGAAEGFSALVVFGVVLWSLASKVLRGAGLPAGLFGVLGLAEGLSYLGALVFLLAVALNQLDPEDNPLRGFSLDAPEKSVQTLQTKTIKSVDKASKFIEKESAPALARFDASVKDAAKQAADKATQVSDEIGRSAPPLPALKVNTQKIEEMQALAQKAVPQPLKDALKDDQAKDVPAKEAVKDAPAK